MFDTDIAIKLLYGAYYQQKKVNPYDYILGAATFNLKLVDQESDIYNLTLKYMNSREEANNKYFIQNMFEYSLPKSQFFNTIGMMLKSYLVILEKENTSLLTSLSSTLEVKSQHFKMETGVLVRLMQFKHIFFKFMTLTMTSGLLIQRKEQESLISAASPRKTPESLSTGFSWATNKHSLTNTMKKVSRFSSTYLIRKLKTMKPEILLTQAEL